MYNYNQLDLKKIIMPIPDFESLLEKTLNGENKALSLWSSYSNNYHFDEQEVQKALKAIDEVLLDLDSPKRKNALFLKGHWYYLGIGMEKIMSRQSKCMMKQLS
jgi:hypothetical protein